MLPMNFENKLKHVSKNRTQHAGGFVIDYFLLTIDYFSVSFVPSLADKTGKILSKNRPKALVAGNKN